MSGFLASLLILVSTFILGGKPIDVPPSVINEVTSRGTQVSDLVKKANYLSPTPTPLSIQTENLSDEENHDGSEDENELENGQGGSTESDVEKVPAYNNSSENEMPTEVPQEAVDNSPALEESPSEDSIPTPTPTPTPTVEQHPFVPMPAVDNPGCGCGSGNGKTETTCVCNN